MEAGRELDEMVAEKVMGWTRVGNYGTDTGYWDVAGKHGSSGDIVWCEDMPEFSTDISAAWEVVEKMKDDGHPIMLTFEHGFGWAAPIGRNASGVLSETASLAICLAALKAVGVEVPA